VITDKIRDDYFGKNQSVVGKTIAFNGLQYRIIGVVKGSPITRPVTYADVFLPYNSPKSEYESSYINGGYMAIIRARNKSDMPTITKEYDQIIDRIPKPFMHYDMKVYHLESHAGTYLGDFTHELFGNERNGVFLTVVSLFIGFVYGTPGHQLGQSQYQSYPGTFVGDQCTQSVWRPLPKPYFGNLWLKTYSLPCWERVLHSLSPSSSSWPSTAVR